FPLCSLQRLHHRGFDKMSTQAPVQMVRKNHVVCLHLLSAALTCYHRLLDFYRLVPLWAKTLLSSRVIRELGLGNLWYLAQLQIPTFYGINFLSQILEADLGSIEGRQVSKTEAKETDRKIRPPFVLESAQ